MFTWLSATGAGESKSGFVAFERISVVCFKLPAEVMGHSVGERCAQKQCGSAPVPTGGTSKGVVGEAAVDWLGSQEFGTRFNVTAVTHVPSSWHPQPFS